MSLTEIEFELPAEQYMLMDRPGLQQGASLTLTLDGGVLLPDSAAEHWFWVQQEPLTPAFVRVGSATYAFAGRIDTAEIEYGREQIAHLSIDCGILSLRVTCAPGDEGLLPEGTWETRYICGLALVQGIVDESFETGVGESVTLTIWQFERLVLEPGDPNFGRRFESDSLPPAPYRHDRIFVNARLHRRTI